MLSSSRFGQAIKNGLILNRVACAAQGDEEQFEPADLFMLKGVGSLRQNPIAGAVKRQTETVHFADGTRGLGATLAQLQNFSQLQLDPIRFIE